MVSENISASQITVDFIASLPKRDVDTFSAGDYNRDGQVTTIEMKVDRRGKVLFPNDRAYGGKQGVDWQFDDLPEGRYGRVTRRIIAQKGTSGLVWDSNLGDDYSENQRVAIVTDVNSGNWDEVK